MAVEEIKPLIEALIFVSSDPLSLRDLQRILDEYPPEEVEAALRSLNLDFESGTRGLILGQMAGGYQILTIPSADDWIRKMLKSKNQDRLTLAALETLAIIAYKQPITLPEILALRKVNSTGVIKTLLDKNLIRIMGRKKVVGNPILYGTSKEFLHRFGLNSLKDLPSLEEFQSLAEQSGIELLEESAETAAAAAESQPGEQRELDQSWDTPVEILAGDEVISGEEPRESPVDEMTGAETEQVMAEKQSEPDEPVDAMPEAEKIEVE